MTREEEKKKAVKKDSAKSTDQISLPPKPPAFIPTAEASAADLENRMEGLEKRLDAHKDEQRTIIVGVLIAAVLIVVTVAVEVIISNSAYNGSLDSLRTQENQDYHQVQNEILQVLQLRSKN